MTQGEADAFARRWIAAWNSHDLDAILSHYTDDVQVTSPFIASLLGEPGATLEGKAAVRAYWGAALERFPELHFTLHAAYAGAGSLVLVYQSIQHLVAAEVMQLDSSGRVMRMMAHYRNPSA